MAPEPTGNPNSQESQATRSAGNRMIASAYHLCETPGRLVLQPLAAVVGSSAGRSPCGRQLWLGGPRGAIVMAQDRTPHQRHIAPKKPRHLSLKVTQVVPRRTYRNPVS